MQVSVAWRVTILIVLFARTGGAQTPPPAGLEFAGLNWSGSVTTRLDPGFHLNDTGSNTVDPRFDSGLMALGTSEYLDFNTYIRLKRNEGQRVIRGNPASYVGPSGAYLGEAVITLKPTNWLSVYAGKLHGSFGAAWLLQTGFIETFAEDYEQTERVGYGVRVTLPPMPVLGSVRISVDNFFADNNSFGSGTRALPGDFVTVRPPPYLYGPQGYGPASTGRLNSYTVSVSGGDQQDGLYWQFSKTQEATGYAGGSAEQGAAATLAYGTGIIDDQTRLRGFAEFAQFSNFVTVSGLTYNALTTGLQLTRGRWEVDVVGDLRRVRGTYRAHDSKVGVNVLRDLSDDVVPGLRVGAGFERLVVGTTRTWALYPYLEYRLVF